MDLIFILIALIAFITAFVIDYLVSATIGIASIVFILVWPFIRKALLANTAFANLVSVGKISLQISTNLQWAWFMIGLVTLFFSEAKIALCIFIIGSALNISSFSNLKENVIITLDEYRYSMEKNNVAITDLAYIKPITQRLFFWTYFWLLAHGFTALIIYFAFM